MSFDAPAPLGQRALDGIDGVLGELARQRARDYLGWQPTTPVAPAARGRERWMAALAGRARGHQMPGVIAEVKRASPSQGAINDHPPLATAQAYASAGAVAVSVLTEPHRFHGSLQHLQTIAGNLEIPSLRKDFVVHPGMVAETQQAGASAVLLMVSVLGEALAAYLTYVQALGLSALVEVHSERELEMALAAGASCIGVNNRDLRTLRIDRSLALRLIEAGRARAPEAVWVAESGYEGWSTIEPLLGLADGVLMGTHLMAHAHPGEALRALVAEGEETVKQP